MVIVNELSNSFWGVTLNEGKRYTQKLSGAVHVSMAALEPGSNKGDDGPVSVMIQHENANFMLCSLSSGHVFQQTLDLNFNEGEEVTFYLKGKGVVHLTGYMLTGDEYDSESDEDFLPGSSFVESDDSASSDDDDDDDDENVSGGSRKRKKKILDKKSKKPKVEIVDDDEDVDDDDDDEEEEEDSDMEDDDEEEQTPKQKKAEKKKQQNAKQEKSTANVKPKEKKDKNVQKSADSATEPEQSASTVTGEKKKKKRKKNKKKNQESENSAKVTAGSSNEKEGSSKPSSKVIEGVTIEDLKVGHGPEAKSGSTVHVYYTGKLTNGKMFDARNSGKPFKFKLGKKDVIKGWEIGVQGMKVGGRRKLVIPPKMGYGSQNAGTIPPNSTLQFEVELKAVN